MNCSTKQKIKVRVVAVAPLGYADSDVPDNLVAVGDEDFVVLKWESPPAVDFGVDFGTVAIAYALGDCFRAIILDVPMLFAMARQTRAGP